MPRQIEVTKKQEEKQENNLDTLIDEYFEANKIKLEKDKIVKANGTKIKDELASKGIDEYSSNNHTAKLSVSTSMEYDDEKLLKIIKSLPSELSSKLIDTVEIVNLEKFERLIITGEIKATQFKDAEVEKKTTRLLIK